MFGGCLPVVTLQLKDLMGKLRGDSFYKALDQSVINKESSRERGRLMPLKIRENRKKTLETILSVCILRNKCLNADFIVFKQSAYGQLGF